ncbi:hypothetical protein ACOME3_007745 [Neoechinorhynchus agilis]
MLLRCRLASNVLDSEVRRAKNALKTNMFLQLDGTTPICEDIGRQVLCYDRRVPLSELEARIEAVDVDTIKRMMINYVYDRCPAVVGIGPIEQLPQYVRTRQRMCTVLI